MTTPNIIAERYSTDKPVKSNHWKIWLVTSPQLVFGGETIFSALELLLDHFGRDDFAFDQLKLSADNSDRVQITLPRLHLKPAQSSKN